MSKYLLYGTKMIENDNTMKDFAESTIKLIPINDLKEIKIEYGEDKEEKFEELFMDAITESLIDDISRTDIDYEKLMCKYSFEIGNLLYNLENHGYSLQDYSLHFFGDEAKDSFNYLIVKYIYLMVFCVIE